MALVVFLRGVNVGGHRTFRPSVLARELRAFDVVNIGAAGTFVVRKPGPKAKFRGALARKLPFETEIVLCDARDVLALARKNPFGEKAARPGVARFVSVFGEARAKPCPAIPCALPPKGAWLVRVIARKKQFVFGEYRRHMKTIGYLGQLDRMFGGRATTRNWNTIQAIVRVLEASDATGSS